MRGKVMGIGRGGDEGAASRNAHTGDSAGHCQRPGILRRGCRINLHQCRRQRCLHHTGDEPALHVLLEPDAALGTRRRKEVTARQRTAAHAERW